MAKNKVFNVHDLYPKDYRFDYKAFEADPDGYPFTAEDQAYFNAMELEQYEANVPMTAHEKCLLRRWVASGNSPKENAGSKYLCLPGSKGYDFLDVYRIGREIQKAMRGMDSAEQAAYLKEYTGWTDDDESMSLLVIEK